MKKVLKHFKKIILPTRRLGILSLSLAFIFLLAVNLYTGRAIVIGSPEIALASVSPLGEAKGSVIAASCGFGDNSNHFIGDTVCGGTCPAGSTPGSSCLPGFNMINGVNNAYVCYSDASINSFMVSSGFLSYASCYSQGLIPSVKGAPGAYSFSCVAKSASVCISSCTNGATNPPSCDNNVCTNGATNYPSCNNNACTNGATNAPDCTTCPSGQTMVNGQCANSCTNGATNPPTCTTCPAAQTMVNGQCINSCANGATNAPTCSTCPAGRTMVSGQCVVACTNGATNAPQCNSCPYGQVFNGTSCVPGVCANGATNYPVCNTCQTPQYYFNGTSCVPNPCGQVIPPASYGQSCNNGSNACGQAVSGTVQCDGVCRSSSPTNNSGCIQTFTPNTTSVQPNGSVEFFYKLLPVASGTSRACGFYDRSQSAGPDGLGVPIPGLQNLNTDSDRVRINNIQRNTEFCLVCRFSTSDGTPQAPAANHQWVRVIRIGEN